MELIINIVAFTAFAGILYSVYETIMHDKKKMVH